MYVEDAVSDLLKTLVCASDQDTEMYIAHGRNRQAEATFVRLCSDKFHVAQLARSDMDEVYQAIDIDVLKVSKV